MSLVTSIESAVRIKSLSRNFPAITNIHQGDFAVETASVNFFGIVPILTLFYPGNGTLITKGEAQMTCMKTVGPSATKNETKSGSDKNNGDNGNAGIMYGPGMVALVIISSLLTFTML